jgi:hypothetical protein
MAVPFTFVLGFDIAFFQYVDPLQTFRVFIYKCLSQLGLDHLSLETIINRTVDFWKSQEDVKSS